MGISGSALATETGHVILMSNDIRKIPKAINLARKAKRKVFENVFLSFFMRVVILALAFAGHPLVWAAVLTDTGTCLLVIMNSMLLLRGGHGHRHGQKCSRKSYDASEAQKCIGNDIGQNRRQCCSEKNCDSSVLPQVQAECCESTNCASKQGYTEQKVSCESKNCSSVKKCPRECHSSQFDASLDEIVEIPNPGEKQVCCSSSSALPSSGHCKSGATKTGCEVPNLGRKQGCCPKDSTETSRTQCEARTARNMNESDADLVPRCCSGSKCSKSQKANLDCKGEMVKGNAISCCTTDDLEKNLHGPGSTEESSHKGHHDRVKCDDEQRSGCRSQCCASSGLQDCERSGGRDGDLVIGSLQGSMETAAAAHGCCSLENREIGGCCRSYMEECCAKSRSGHLGHHGFGGCLTEIVIE